MQSQNGSADHQGEQEFIFLFDKPIWPWYWDTTSPDFKKYGFANPADVTHSTESQVGAWNEGRLDNWRPAKGDFTMGYYAKADIPVQWTAAKNFTTCDAYTVR